MTRHLTEAEKERIRTLYNRYKGMRVVAAHAGVSSTTVFRIVRCSYEDASAEVASDVQPPPKQNASKTPNKDEDKGKLQAEAEVKIDKGVVDVVSKNVLDDVSKMVKEGILSAGKKAYLKWIAYKDRLKALGYYTVDEFIDDVFERTGNQYIEELERKASSWEQLFYMLMMLYVMT